MARPALSAAFLERVRAAIQADADAEAEDDTRNGAPIPLPRRDVGGTGGPQSPAGMQRAPAAGPKTSSPGDAHTEPIPAVGVPPSMATGAQAADVAGAAPQNAAPAEPATAGVPAAPQAGTAPPTPEAVKAPAKPKASKRAPNPAVVTAPPKPKALKAPPKPKGAKRAPNPAVVTAPPKPKPVKAPPKPPPMHRVPRTGPGMEKPPKRQERASRGYRMAGVLVTTVTVALLAVGFAVFHHSGGNTAGGTSAGRSGTGRGGTGRSGTASARPVDPATLGRNAAAWVAAQVGPAAVISCDPAMCQALEARGLPAKHLYVLKPGMTNPLDSAVIVATPILRSQIGSRLASLYAPGVLAEFGSGNRQIQVRAIALHGPAAYMSQVREDLAARKMSGTALAGNSRIVTSAAARKELAAGDVDSRLMTVITGLAASHPVHIVSFGDSGPDTATAPFRSAELAETNMKKMVATVSGQRSPFRVAHMASVRLGTGQPVLRIDFAAPSPFGLLGYGNGG